MTAQTWPAQKKKEATDVADESARVSWHTKFAAVNGAD
jgi:hypothetical protein